jgi:hypothetical protein
VNFPERHSGPLASGRNAQAFPERVLAREADEGRKSRKKSCESATASAPAHRVNLLCSVEAGAEPAVVRICEVSGQSDTGVACTFADAVANVIVGTTPTPVQFSCPAVRDSMMVGSPPVPQTVQGVGGYSIYRAALGNLGASDSAAPAVTCTSQ